MIVIKMRKTLFPAVFTAAVFIAAAVVLYACSISVPEHQTSAGKPTVAD